jgi:hypothetical protein
MSLILDGSNGLSDVDGTAATPAIRGTDANTGIFFPAADTIAFSEGGVESMRIDSSGNVGIGTSSPFNKLDVKLATDYHIITSGASAYGSNAIVGLTDAGSETVLGLAGDTVRLYTNVTERMRITSNGNLLVGQTVVYSGVGGLSVIPQASGANTCVNLSWNKSTTGGDAAAQFRYNNSVVGSISYTNTAVTYATSSDYRLKENITPMTGALDVVSALKPVTYNWKADGSNSQGFIAHELQAVVPDCVTGEKDAVDEEGNPIYQGIDTSFLVATLTAAIQEQQAMITELKATVDAQAARITALEEAAV